MSGNPAFGPGPGIHPAPASAGLEKLKFPQGFGGPEGGPGRIPPPGRGDYGAGMDGSMGMNQAGPGASGGQNPAQHMQQGFEAFCKSASQFLEEFNKNPNSQEAQSALNSLKSTLSQGPDGENLVKQLDALLKQSGNTEQIKQFLGELVNKGKSELGGGSSQSASMG